MRKKLAALVIGLLLLFSLVGCGSEFERAVSDEMVEIDFWRNFDAASLVEYFPNADTYSLMPGDFVVLARGMVGEDYDLSGMEFENLASVEGLKAEIDGMQSDWVLAKTSMNDYYTSCEFYAIVCYSTEETGEYQYVDIGQTGFKCKPLSVHTVDYYIGAVQDYFAENGVIASNIYESGQQEVYEPGSESLVYSYDIERGNAYGAVAVSFEWDGKGNFVPCDYEYSEALQAQLPPKGAVLEEECEEDKLYILRDGNYYPFNALEAVEIYDNDGNIEEKLCLCTDTTLEKDHVKVISIREDDAIVFFSVDTYVPYYGYFFPAWLPYDHKYINVDKEILNMDEEYPVVYIQSKRGTNEYELEEIKKNGANFQNWEDQMIRDYYRGYIYGDKGDWIKVGGFCGSYYAEDTYMLDSRVVESGTEKTDDWAEYHRTKHGYYLFDKSGLATVGGMYYEQSNGCVVCFE